MNLFDFRLFLLKCTIFLRHIVWFTGMLPFLCLFSFLSFFACALSSIWDKIAFKTGWYKSQVSDGKTHAGRLSKVARASPPVDEL